MRQITQLHSLRSVVKLQILRNSCLGIIPFVVKGNGNTCHTYAPLDDWADKSLCANIW